MKARGRGWRGVAAAAETRGATPPSKRRWWLAAGLALAALCAAAAPITFGTQYLGANADGTHNWATTVYNNFQEASSDYAIHLIIFGTTLAQGYVVVPSSSEWVVTGRTATGEPLTDSFALATGDSYEFIYPQGMVLTFYYTTPAHVDRLGTTVNTFYTDAAGSFAVAGAMPVAAAPAVRVLGVAAGGVAGRRVALGVEGPQGRPSFRLQARAGLDGGDWEDVGRFAVTGAVTTVVATNAAPACFYRAVAP